ncbi:translation factor [Artemisia annua]|uniref:Translation factor GUF1 homolog, mitochondrial n=1 Tax=Artemisia annua TaxID=35608 RepID=A0A2U1LAL8_ARTAN|nr:translation factor [Artemisia annua]
MKEQFLDNMDLERERGITIKLQGVEAQTLANVYLALENNLEVIPSFNANIQQIIFDISVTAVQVLNKIDLPGAEPSRVIQEIEEEGIGINEILSAIVQRIPPPPNSAGRPLRALIFDSYYDAYRGVIVYFRVIDGTVKKGDRILFMASGKDYYADEVGVLSPNQLQVDELYAGEVGYISASIRSVADARVGDTITHYSRKAEESLPGYKEATPMVFCGLFPIDADQFPDLRDALDKLQLNDAALKVKLIPRFVFICLFEPETSSAMGFGFRCGFLGLLHMEIVQERLEREYNLSLITTAPSVVYKVFCTNGEIVDCSNPSALPEQGKRKSIEEPIVKIEMLTPKDYIGSLMELSQDRRGEFKEMKFITENRASLTYEMPLAEMVGDFFDQLKSRSKGYASMEYSFIGYKESDLIKLDVLINGEGVEPLSTIVHKDKAYSVGRALTQKLKELIPRQMFKVPIQACIGTKVIASEALSAIRKDVLAKCYGGDISRKKKLLKKQAAGKKRMKAIGKVDVPQEAFMAVLKLEKEVL